jgi:hypothetical protein
MVKKHPFNIGKKTKNYTTVDPKHLLNTNSVVAEHAQTHGTALTA